MDTLSSWHNEALGQRAVKALEKNRFAAAYFADRESAVAHIMGLVPEGAGVGIGGSATVKALGIDEKLKTRGCAVLDHNAAGLSLEEKTAIRRKQLSSDVFICSSNAVTLKGELVNTDGVGNRVAAMIFGPKRTIVIAGTNKLVRDVDEAHKRIQMLAAPLNNKRLGTSNPCTVTGECADCHTDTRICNVTTVMNRKPSAADIHVVLIGEELGY